MKKEELVRKIASDAKISKVAAEKVLNAFKDGVKSSLKEGKKVTLTKFGTFGISRRSTRIGRNPATGGSIKIPERKVPKFRPSKSLKDIVKLSTSTRDDWEKP